MLQVKNSTKSHQTCTGSVRLAEEQNVDKFFKWNWTMKWLQTNLQHTRYFKARLLLRLHQLDPKPTRFQLKCSIQQGAQDKLKQASDYASLPGTGTLGLPSQRCQRAGVGLQGHSPGSLWRSAGWSLENSWRDWHSAWSVQVAILAGLPLCPDLRLGSG